MTRQDVITDQTASHINAYILEVTQNMKPFNVYELIDLVQHKFPFSKDEITEIILQLESQNKIYFNNKTCQVSLSLKKYIFSSSVIWYWLTLVLASLATITVFIIPQSVYPFTYLRYLVGAVFVGFLPGFAFLKILYPSKMYWGMFPKNACTLEQMVLSIGLSIALVALAGLVLNFTPFGIGLMPLTLTILVLIVIFASVGIIRSYGSRIIK